MNWKDILDTIKTEVKSYVKNTEKAESLGKKIGVKKVNETKTGKQYEYKDGTGYYVEKPKLKNTSKK